MDTFYAPDITRGLLDMEPSVPPPDIPFDEDSIDWRGPVTWCVIS